MGTKAKWMDGNLIYYSGYEHVKPVAPVVFYDDFLGYKLNKYIANENTTAPWATVETVGTVVALDDTVNGWAELAITNADSTQNCTLYFGDNLCFSLKQDLVFECRAGWTVLPTAGGGENSQTVIGLASAHNATLDTVATNVWFRVEAAANTALLWETDDGNTDDDDNSCATTIAASTYYIFRIDCRDLVNGVRFYVNNALVGTSGDFLTNLSDAEAKVQPYFNVSKTKAAANTATGTMVVDYVRIWQNRS